jgi:hypothetical protein
MKALPILLASLLAASLPLAADPLIPRAQQREKAGDTEAAAKLYGAWLQGNVGAPGSARVFSRYFRLENDYLALRDASLRFLAAGRGLPGAAEQFTAIARLFELGGMTGEARDAYLSAHTEGAADSTLVSAFLLSLQMHDTDAMTKCLAGLEPRGASVAVLLQVLADAEAGRGETAEAALAGLADTSADPDVALKALWVTYARAVAAEDRKGQANTRARLSRDFPGAPETALASSLRSDTVVLFPSPDVFITTDVPRQPLPAPEPAQPPAVQQTTEPAPLSPAPLSPAPQVAEPARVSVQAGSFQVKENADDLSTELSKRGFSPTQRVETIQGKEHFRVFAGVGLEAVQARALLARLLQEGFSGILVTEK